VRYAYDQFDAYFSPGRTRGYGLKRYLIDRLRRWDQRTSGRPDRYLANSTRVAERIRAAYGREAGVVFPPVDTGFFTPSESVPEDYALCVGALVPYKKFDRAIEWSRRSGRPLTIVGTGPEENRLREMAPSSVSFEKDLSRDELRERYRKCAFFLQPGEEDFGIASVEAQACGRPVVALGQGGAADVVAPGTGSMFSEATPEAIVGAIDSLHAVGFNPERAIDNAQRFSTRRFRDDFAREVQALTE
jgi:glycosyltransferase involved in cell wall biosynthesis